ncbi:MAG: type II toxin-antitoxin system RelE/ParE family toxin [Chitinophagales bacterium]|nr:type II toxin-antitoxin system RelE/ParE family toxin [Chitinophagales bacterium]
MRVLWTDTAISQLEQIFFYYAHKASPETAIRITQRIVDKTLILGSFSRIGQRENDLMHRAQEYRYLVEGNYKIIYWVETRFVKIASVFDCRQNPEKISVIA